MQNSKRTIQEAHSVIRLAIHAFCILTFASGITAGRVFDQPSGTCSGAGQESSVWTGAGGWNRV